MSKLIGIKAKIRYCETCGSQCIVKIIDGGFSEKSGEKIYRLYYRCPKASDNFIKYMYGEFHTEKTDLDIELYKDYSGNYYTKIESI